MARTLGDLVAVIGADTAPFEQALSGVAQQISGAAANIKTVGTQIATQATEPITKLGTAAQTTAAEVTQATTQMGTASKAAAVQVAELGKAQQATTEAHKAAAPAVEETGKKTSILSGLFQGLKDKATELVPGLGSVLSIATGLGGGLAALEVAKQVGGWLLDVGGKALESSGDLKSLNDLFAKISEALEGTVASAIKLLAGLIGATIGPAIGQLINWISEGLKWLTAFSDWFTNLGAFQLFGAALQGLAGMFQPLLDAVKQTWAAISEAFGGFGSLFGNSTSAAQVAMTILSGLFQGLGAAVSLVFTLIKSEIQLFLTALTGVVQFVGWFAPKVIGFFKDLYAGTVEWFSKIAQWIQASFAGILSPIEAVFARLWQIIAGWATDVMGFLAKFIGSIPGLQNLASSFASINTELLNFGRAAVTGTAAQKAHNDQVAEAAARAKALADAQKALGVTVIDATAAVKQSAVEMQNWHTVIGAASSSPSELAAATIAAFNSISTARKQIEEKGTADQKAALDAQIAELRNYAAAHGITLGQIVAQTAAAAEAVDKTITDFLTSIGYVSQAVMTVNISQLQQGWEFALSHMAANTQEFAQVTTRTYDAIQAARQKAADAGYTAEVQRLDQLSAAIRSYADKNQIVLQSDVKAWAAVADAIAKIPPQVSLADRVIAEMGDTALESAAKAAGAFGDLHVKTDQEINDTIANMLAQYNAMVNIAGTSSEEQLRIAREMYSQLKDQLNQYGASVNDANRQAVGAAIDSANKIALENHTTLETRKADVQQHLTEETGFWAAFNDNISKGMRKASQDLTDAIWSGDKSFGQIAMQTLEDIGKGLTKTFLQTGLTAVGQFVSKALEALLKGDGSLMGAFSSLKKAFEGIFSGGAGAAQNALGGLTGGGGGGGAAGGGGGAAGAVSGVLGTISSVTGIVTGAISAVTGIINSFQLKGQTKVMENIQQLLGMIYPNVFGLHEEGIAYFHFAEKWLPIIVTRLDNLTTAVNVVNQSVRQAGGGPSTTNNNYYLTVNASGGSLDGLIRTLQAQGFVLT